MVIRLLVVDDSATVRDEVVRALQSTGFEIIEAMDGNDAFTKLGAHPDIKLVISDINMPWKDGLELLADMREDESMKLIPVILLTTEANPEHIATAKKFGAKAWLIKPFKHEQLLKVVKSLVA